MSTKRISINEKTKWFKFAVGIDNKVFGLDKNEAANGGTTLDADFVLANDSDLLPNPILWSNGLFFIICNVDTAFQVIILYSSSQGQSSPKVLFWAKSCSFSNIKLAIFNNSAFLTGFSTTCSTECKYREDK